MYKEKTYKEGQFSASVEKVNRFEGREGGAQLGYFSQKQPLSQSDNKSSNKVHTLIEHITT